MTLVRRACAAATILLIAIAIAQVMGNQRVVHADVVPVSGQEIVCQVYEYLQAEGLPIPPGLNADGCDGEGGGTPTPGSTQCSNLIDDDGDNKIDFIPGNDLGDPDCENLADNTESPENPGGGGGDGGGDGGGNPGGGDSGGGSGGPAPQCEDSIDNDGDGLIDSNDSGCENAADNDETNPTSSGGGGGGGGGGSGGSTEAATSTEAVAATPEPEPVLSCDLYLTEFIKFGAKNNPEQVSRLQKVLIDVEGADISENGEYDAKTLAAVHTFQTKYASDILTPWGMTKSSGFVYLTTRKKVNELYCKMEKEFPLTDEEKKVIEEYKTVQVQADHASEDHEEVPVVEKKEEEKPKEIGSKAKESQTASAQNAEEPARGAWSSIRSFFGRIFGR